MPSFKTRSYKKELLDSDDLPFDDIRKNMEELDVINKYLGGHAITISGIKKLLANCSSDRIHIVEIGSGGGDNLFALRKWSDARKQSLRLTGIDVNPQCIKFARQQHADINFIHSDYRDVSFEEQPDIIFSSLFTHHFTDEEIIEMLKWMWSNSSIGFLINDLHRHPVAYSSIRLLTQLLSKSYLVKNDAPLSVQRAF